MKKVFEFQGEKIPVEITRNGDQLELQRGTGKKTFFIEKSNSNFQFVRDGKPFDVSVLYQKNGEAYVSVNGKTLVLQCLGNSTEKTNHNGSGETVVSVMPGRVVKVHVTVGDVVAVGDPLLVLEAMKMENEIKATSSGKIEALYTKEGASVESGVLLLKILPEGKA